MTRSTALAGLTLGAATAGVVLVAAVFIALATGGERGTVATAPAPQPVLLVQPPAKPDFVDRLGKVLDLLTKIGSVVGIGGAWFVVSRWQAERSDRSAEVLLKLQEIFRSPEVRKACDVVDNDANFKEDSGVLPVNQDPSEKLGANAAVLDPLLQFYVLLLGMLQTGQLNREAARICFWYYLCAYHRHDRLLLKRYIDSYYPTLSKWLADDSELDETERFFRRSLLTGIEKPRSERPAANAA